MINDAVCIKYAIGSFMGHEVLVLTTKDVERYLGVLAKSSEYDYIRVPKLSHYDRDTLRQNVMEAVIRYNLARGLDAYEVTEEDFVHWLSIGTDFSIDYI